METITKQDVISCAEFCVPGEPMGKQRHRMGNGRAYTPAKTAHYESVVRMCWNINKPDTWSLDGQYHVQIEAKFTIPKSKPKKWKRDALAGKIYVTKRPDCDNIAKIILDGLNGLAFKDDAQVANLIVKKIYTPGPPCVRVKILDVSDKLDL